MPREDNICYIVAVRLSQLDVFRWKSATVNKHYKPYECFTLPVNNVKSKKMGFIRPLEKVMYCPASTIILDDDRQLEVNRFLIGKGDNRRNSIRVYHLNDHGKSMDLLFYMYDVLTYFPMLIDRVSYYDTRIRNLSRQYRFHGLDNATRKFLDYYDGPGFVRSSSHKGEFTYTYTNHVPQSST